MERNLVEVIYIWNSDSGIYCVTEIILLLPKWKKLSCWCDLFHWGYLILFCLIFFSFDFFDELHGNGCKILEMYIHSIIHWFLLYFPSSLLMVEHKSIMKCFCVAYCSSLDLPLFNCNYTTNEIIKLCWKLKVLIRR